MPRARLQPARSPGERVRAIGWLVAIHLLPLIAIARGTSKTEWLAFPIFYTLLALTVGVGLHRYFAHRAYKTSRPFQFFLGASACLTFSDPIGFAGKHRIHHRFSDTDDDVHRPEDGFWHCWFGAHVDEGYTDAEVVEAAKDLARYPELLWLHRYFYLPGIVFGAVTWVVGGFNLFAIGYCLSLAMLVSLTSSVNYFCHRAGSRRYATPDLSRNNVAVALLTFGEGWHNNHHHYPTSARAGFYWWEFDPLYLVIRGLAMVGLIWDVREVPDRVKRAHAA